MAPPVVQAAAPLPIPAVGKPRPIRLPTAVTKKLRNGMRVVVARRPGIPRFECRLLVPMVRGGVADPARLRVLAETVLSGTATLTSREIAEELQGLGAGLGSDLDAEQLILGGSSLTQHRTRFLEMFADVLINAAFPSDEVAIERERIVQEIALLRSQPGVIASDALVGRLYGAHPYGRGTPDPDAVARVQAAALRKLHGARVHPQGSVLVMAGDLDVDATLADVTTFFGRWRGAENAGGLAAPSFSTPPSILVVDRPGAVQTNIRMGGPGLRRTDPQHPALALAVTVFAGYFTSRLNDNIREQKGYTYGAHARIEHRRVASQLTVLADVGREVTAPALVETLYELGRMASLPVEQSELDSARRYLQGAMAMGLQTQGGLTSYLSMLAAADLPLEYLREYPKRLERVTVDDVLEASRAYLNPHALTMVLVGDAAAIEPMVRPIGDVERASS